MIKDIKKISIIGGPGTGKTTLSENFGEKLGLPIYHIDGIHHLDNWKIRDKKERDDIILRRIQETKWVMDGTYKTTLEARVERSDLVIFLNYSTISKLKGIFSRYFKGRGKEKREIPGCREKMDCKFIKFTIMWNKTKGSTIKDVLDKNKDKNILIFKNRNQLNTWYKKEFKEKINLNILK